MSVSGGRALSRRAVLGGLGGMASANALGGCSSGEGPPAPRPSPDVAVLVAAMTAERGLIAVYEAVLREHAGLAERLNPMLAHHREHLAVLGRHHVPGSTPEVTPAPVVPPAVPKESSQALELLRDAERRAAAARAEDVRRVAPAMAQLLASIGAGEAWHAAVLGEDR
ncbi:MAG TPA: hypothetical protein VHJ17_02260 [Thermomonospora sp.]|nr:hypothetical protein [Thermomonospora sp.]